MHNVCYFVHVISSHLPSSSFVFCRIWLNVLNQPAWKLKMLATVLPAALKRKMNPRRARRVVTSLKSAIKNAFLGIASLKYSISLTAISIIMALTALPPALQSTTSPLYNPLLQISLVPWKRILEPRGITQVVPIINVRHVGQPYKHKYIMYLGEELLVIVGWS